MLFLNNFIIFPYSMFYYCYLVFFVLLSLSCCACVPMIVVLFSISHHNLDVFLISFRPSVRQTLRHTAFCRPVTRHSSVITACWLIIGGYGSSPRDPLLHPLRRSPFVFLCCLTRGIGRWE